MHHCRIPVFFFFFFFGGTARLWKNNERSWIDRQIWKLSVVKANSSGSDNLSESSNSPSLVWLINVTVSSLTRQGGLVYFSNSQDIFFDDVYRPYEFLFHRVNFLFVAVGSCLSHVLNSRRFFLLVTFFKLIPCKKEWLSFARVTGYRGILTTGRTTTRILI